MEIDKLHSTTSSSFGLRTSHSSLKTNDHETHNNVVNLLLFDHRKGQIPFLHHLIPKLVQNKHISKMTWSISSKRNNLHNNDTKLYLINTK